MISDCKWFLSIHSLPGFCKSFENNYVLLPIMRDFINKNKINIVLQTKSSMFTQSNLLWTNFNISILKIGFAKKKIICLSQFWNLYFLRNCSDAL